MKITIKSIYPALSPNINNLKTVLNHDDFKGVAFYTEVSEINKPLCHQGTDLPVTETIKQLGRTDLEYIIFQKPIFGVANYFNTNPSIDIRLGRWGPVRYFNIEQEVYCKSIEYLTLEYGLAELLDYSDNITLVDGHMSQHKPVTTLLVQDELKKNIPNLNIAGNFVWKNYLEWFKQLKSYPDHLFCHNAHLNDVAFMLNNGYNVILPSESKFEDNFSIEGLTKMEIDNSNSTIKLVTQKVYKSDII